MIARWAHYAVASVLLALIFWFYLWTVGQGKILAIGTTQPNPYYNGLADAFAAGHVSLPLAPHPALLALADPYDPDANAPYRLHDASLYKGKYYLYFGVTPVVLLFLPFRALTTGHLPMNAAAALFSFGGVCFSLLTLVCVRRRLFATRDVRVSYASVLMLGFGGAIPFLLRRPDIYEVAISSGFFCGAAAVYFLVSSTSGEGVSCWRLGLGSLFLGLAVGARPNLILAAPLMAVPAWTWKYRDREERRRTLRRMAALVLPFMAVLFLLGLYNYLRFDSWTEFGMSYQLAGVDVRQLKFDISRIPSYSYLYLWQSFHVNMAFPYTHVIGVDALPPPGSFLEPIAGLFLTTPILVVLGLLPVSWWLTVSGTRRGNASAYEGTLCVYALVLVAIGALEVLFLSMFPGVTMRYVVDFSPFLMTAAGIVMIGLERQLEGHPRIRIFERTAIVLLVALTVFFNTGIGITGYYDNLRGANPAAYGSLKSVSDRVIDLVAPRFLGKDFQLISVSAPSGVVQGVNLPSFWVGHDDAEMEVVARRSGFLSLQVDLAMGPSRPDLMSCRLTMRTGGGFSETVTVGNQAATLAMPVTRGHNKIFFRIEKDPSLSSKNDPDTMLLRVRDFQRPKD